MGTATVSHSRRHWDTYGHAKPVCPAPALPGLALANSAGTTVGIGPLAASGTGGAGAGSTFSYNGGTSTGATAVDTNGTNPNDARGQFVITTAGTPVAGLIAQVVFTEPYSTPVNVVVSAVDTTASPVVSVPVGAVLTGTAPGATTGFTVATSSSLTTAHAVLITYHVEP
jgi:hypothetical protein